MPLTAVADPPLVDVGAAAGGGIASELHLLRDQVSGMQERRRNSGGRSDDDDEEYSSEFEDEQRCEEEIGGADDSDRPGAQLLGMTRGAMGSASLRNGGGGPGGPVRVAARETDGGPVELLSAGLPAAGLGFGGSGSWVAQQEERASRRAEQTGITSRQQEMESGPKAANIASVESPSGKSSSFRLAPLNSGGQAMLPSVPALLRPPGFALTPITPSKKDKPVAVDGGWKLSAAARNKVATASRAGMDLGQISLNETLTNRAAFLQRELSEQLGGKARLGQACEAVRALNARTKAAEGGLGDAAIREALVGIISPAHLELAPLLDELVLLQDRFFIT